MINIKTNKTLRFVFVLTFSFFLIISCEKETIKIDNLVYKTDFPDSFLVKAGLGAAYDTTYCSASIPITIRSTGKNDIMRLCVCYSCVNKEPTLKDQILELGTFKATKDSFIQIAKLENLIHKKVYYYRAYCQISRNDSAYSIVKHFSTPRDERLALMKTDDAQWVSLNSAVLCGIIVNTGKSNHVLEHGFVWAFHAEPDINDSKINLGNSGVQKFSYEAIGLLKDTVYHYRSYAINDYGVDYGDEKVFYTSKSFAISIGSYGTDQANAVQQTIDGGFIVAGSSDSNIEGSLLSNHGGKDYFIVKLYPNGKEQWHTYLGGTGDDEAFSIVQTKDSGFIIAGISYGGIPEAGTFHGKEDAYIVKLSSKGQVEWQKFYGGAGIDYAYSIKEISSGGYIIGGQTTSKDGDVSLNNGGQDFWIFKLTQTGEIVWSKTFGGSETDIGSSVVEDSNNGFVFVGTSCSQNGDFQNGRGNWDIWILKLSSDGNLTWKKSLGGYGNDSAESPESVQNTSDGGVIIAGTSASYDGDVSGVHGSSDFWVVKLTPTGSVEWQHAIGGSNLDYAKSIQQTSDGSYIVTGYSLSTDGNITGNKGGIDYWVVKLSSSGAIIWQKNLGGSDTDIPNSIRQTYDHGYIVAGYSRSNNGDIHDHKMDDDFWVLRFYEEDFK
jgi:hypothetical protein